MIATQDFGAFEVSAGPDSNHSGLVRGEEDVLQAWGRSGVDGERENGVFFDIGGSGDDGRRSFFVVRKFDALDAVAASREQMSAKINASLAGRETLPGLFFLPSLHFCKKKKVQI